MSHRGGCHCGKIGFEVDGEFDRVVECNCLDGIEPANLAITKFDGRSL